MSITHAKYVITRALNAAPARVFNAFADEAAHRRWFVEGEDFEIAEYAHDFRVFGHERSRFKPKGSDVAYTNDTIYHVIAPNERIVFSYAMGREGVAFSVSLATIELTEENGGTRLVFTEQAAFFENADGAAMREQGWNALFDALARELAR